MLRIIDKLTDEDSEIWIILQMPEVGAGLDEREGYALASHFGLPTLTSGSGHFGSLNLSAALGLGWRRSREIRTLRDVWIVGERFIDE